mmetsp:Transcript_16568/g.32693  ORF Transcript_16568/g.32693 Transcript_16568/m.32693 type:complete len:207 (-) Transcript_16568:1719-2339(-)
MRAQGLRHVAHAGHGLDVSRDVPHRLHPKVLDKHVQDVLGHKGRQRGPDADGLEAQVQAGQQHGDCLLLVPRQHDGEGEILDLALERPGKRQRDAHRAVRVVALPHVQHPRDPRVAHVAQPLLGLVADAVLAAPEGEDHAGVGQVLREVRVVVPALSVPVAPPDEVEARDGACLHPREHRGRRPDDCLVPKPDRERLLGRRLAVCG